MSVQIAATENKNAVRTESRVDEQLFKVGFVVLGLSSCAVGVWAMASLIGGMVASGGPVGLIANWFSAVFG